ncbi:TPA: aspartate carbamoyltransferase catalytic subunit [Legionella pneumophila]|nr:aspartate carbamoyltransferase catalytic subunit [Legionella pneumophila]HAT8642227.1 aspartate carbamoyltransferase catalytic subunit [Legionella pneumophila]HAT8868655.1 aspartate carbamoyltransferase catalytic subunit [Legionella pneumophila subsp. pneumophila]HAT8890155.1 aspartate carbamoyltransferase catalytic subunit [Legionella pneumophila subsp. pneumophila]HAT8933840.1 aspartate carbamoyltransferase catalytic subunit [Legionella pneumophila subsp. pneumophila]
MKHFLEISQLSSEQIESLLQRALYFKHTKRYPSYSQSIIANLFYENSTRTRISFELAERHLGMSVVNLDLQTSSETKGEAIEDTIRTLAAMGIQYLVIRHKQDGLQQDLANKLSDRVHIINAGDGTHAHPSQAILDMVTIIEQKKRLDKLKIAILGNIKHSRVANSFQCICSKLGVGELVLISPEIWQPSQVHFGRVTDNLNEGLDGADVVICLRVQRERLLEDDHLDLDFYRNNFALTQKSLSYAKPDAMVMHPGPMNRGVEIDSEVVDGNQSFILQQVTNGVYARMAILESLIGS